MIHRQNVIRTILNICDHLTKAANDFHKNGFYAKSLHFHEASKLVLEDASGRNDLLPSEETMFEEYIESTVSSIDMLKPLIKKDKYPKVISIKDGDTGYDYHRIVKDALSGDVTWVKVIDPYIRSYTQVENLRSLIETLKTHEPNLTEVTLSTTIAPYNTSESNSQKQSLDNLQIRMAQMYPEMHFYYRHVENLHDRKILFSNGFIISLGRGLDIYYGGRYVPDLQRPCKETDIYIFKEVFKAD